MLSDNHPHQSRTSMSRAIRHHPVVVAVCLVVGALAGLLYATTLSTHYTSTATVLVNPSVGNPFVPSPTSVRQDELTSLETEAQVARSAEVLKAVTAENASLTLNTLGRNLHVVVPASSQTLVISYSASDPDQAQLIANQVADAYLANRAHRFDDVNTAQIARLSAQTAQVVRDLRAATAAAQQGGPAKQAFQNQLATALRNQLVSIRAQRTVLENSDVPAGSVITPAVPGHAGLNLAGLIAPVGGALAGLALGCLIAVLMEGLAGSIRAPHEVEELGLPVVAAVPRSRGSQLLRRHNGEAFDTTIRRLRASILDLDPRPDIITVAPPGDGPSEAPACEAIAESFAKAGHRVVLVRTDPASGDGDGLVVEEGLAQALLYERLNVMELLVPSREPLLGVLPSGGFSAQSREFLTSARLRSVLMRIVESGSIVVIESPGLGTVEGEAMAGAADLTLVAVTTRRTRTRTLAALVHEVAAKGTPVAALVLGRHDGARTSRVDPVDEHAEPGPQTKAKSDTHEKKASAPSTRPTRKN